ncbi:MAG: aspartate ammonia-lyase, partial [Cyanobacteria bacterium J06648_1]
NTINSLSDRCLAGITPRRDRCLAYAESSLALVTALNTHIGYLKAADVAKKSLATGKSIRAIVLEEELMTEEQLAVVLDLDKMSKIPE